MDARPPGAGLAAPAVGLAAPAVALLHGQPGSAASWSAVTPLLESRYSLVVEDRPGYPGSREPAGGFRANAEALVRHLDRAEIDKAILVGHSWGGGVAIAAAERFSERVCGLVLVASVRPGEALGLVDRALTRRPFGDALAVTAFAVAGALLAAPGARVLTSRLPDTALVSLAGLSLVGGHRRTAQAFMVEQRALVDELPGLAEGLAALEVPVEVVVGDADRVVAPEVGERLAAKISTARLSRVEGAGHLLVLERPDAVAAAVDRVAARRRQDSPDGQLSQENPR